jgi:hypothetical protein
MMDNIKISSNKTAALAEFLLREDPLSTGILDSTCFFENIVSCVSFSKREFIYLRIAQIFNSFKLESGLRLAVRFHA